MSYIVPFRYRPDFPDFQKIDKKLSKESFWSIFQILSTFRASAEMSENHHFSIFWTIFRTHRKMSEIVDFSIFRNIQDLHTSLDFDNTMLSLIICQPG